MENNMQPRKCKSQFATWMDEHLVFRLQVFVNMGGCHCATPLRLLGLWHSIYGLVLSAWGSEVKGQSEPQDVENWPVAFCCITLVQVSTLWKPLNVR